MRNLLSIYFKILASPFQMPILFDLYFRSDFKLDKFLEFNEATISSYSISADTENSPKKKLLIPKFSIPKFPKKNSPSTTEPVS